VTLIGVHRIERRPTKRDSYGADTQRDFSKILIGGKIGRFGREIDKISGFILVFLERDESSLITLYSYFIERFNGFRPPKFASSRKRTDSGENPIIGMMD